MHLTEPMGLLLLGLLLPLVLLYLLRPRPATLMVGALWLWRDSSRTARVPRPSKRFWNQRSFWLQAAALLALAFAAAGPRSQTLTLSRHVALVIDSSASMQTREESGETRFAQAVELADRVVTALHPDADVLLIGAAESPLVLLPFERDRRRIRERLRSLRPLDVRGELHGAVTLAREKLAQQPGGGELVLLSDLVLADRVVPELPAGSSRLVRVGTAADNLAITRIDVRSEPTPDDRSHDTTTTTVFASVQNFSASTKEIFVTLRQRNVQHLVASTRATLAAGEERPVTLRFTTTQSDQGTGLLVELSPGDRLPVDDRAHGVVPTQGRQAVVVVATQPSKWLDRALLADPGVTLQHERPETFAPDRVSPDALLFYRSHCPEHAPPQSHVVMNPPPGTCLGMTVGEPLELPVVTHWDEADPRFRFSSLSDLTITEARRVVPASAAQGLLWSGQAALMARTSAVQRDGTLLGFDLDATNWPLKASFVLFVRNLVDMARERRSSGAESTARTGSPLLVRVPSDVSRVRVALPDGEERELPVHAGTALLAEVDRAGFYHFSWQGNTPGSRLLPVNLLSGDESDPHVDALIGDAASRADLPTNVPRDHDWTPWLGALALGLAGIDALLRHRSGVDHIRGRIT